MTNNNLPKVMAISITAWRKNSGTHTQTDLFKFYESDRVAQIYARSELPDTTVCNNFYRISENEVLKSVFTRKNVGKTVKNSVEADKKEQKSIKMENAIYTMAHKKKSWFLTILREIVWSLGKWKTTQLDEFIENYNPDVYFFPVYSVIYTAKIQQYVLKKFPRPYVCYITDDNYSYKSCGKNIFSYIHRFFLRKYVKKLSVNSAEMFVMTKVQKEEVDRNFGTDSTILTKGINYENLEYKEKKIANPVKMVYTGNLLIGRAKSLVEISKAMKNINKDGEKITFDIFSTTALDEKTLEYLNSNGCHFHGCVPKSQVDDIQKQADIVVFSESLEKKYRYEARLSFSTKLTDYFKNGKCIFAIGDKDIAPIIYLKENDCALIATNYNEIEDKLKSLIDAPEKIEEYSKKAFYCGMKNHNEKDIKKVFLQAFIKADKLRGDRKNG